MNTNKSITHYYGDSIRILFIVCGATILFGLPIVTSALGIPAVPALLMVILLGVSAGLANPIQEGTMLLNIVVSLLGLLVFTYVSWYMYQNMMIGTVLVINQIITVLFLVGLYLSIKTYRGARASEHSLLDQLPM